MNWTVQLIRFGLVGLISNLVIYMMYLAITYAGAEHKLAMTLLFAVGTLQTFFFNKQWTFKHRGNLQQALVKYVVIYGIAYLLNLLALFFLVDHIGYPHQLVQGVTVFALALMLFITLRHWVFANSRDFTASEDILDPRSKL